MKAKRIAIMIFVFTMLFGASVYADSLWGSYEGYSKVKVRMNGTEMGFGDGEVPAFTINNRTVMPLSKMADSLHALVKWDESTKTVDLYKPNVHMFFSKDIGTTDYSLIKPFAKVDHGNSVSFFAFIQIDNLKISPKNFRITIEDPDGKQAVDPLVVPLDKPESSFWFTYLFKVNFNQAGTYTVKFAFENNGGYTVVSEKTITAE
jgi:hypothetical protein